MRPHLLLSGRTVHPEIPEDDDQIELAAKMREARELLENLCLGLDVSRI